MMAASLEDGFDFLNVMESRPTSDGIFTPLLILQTSASSTHQTSSLSATNPFPKQSTPGLLRPLTAATESSPSSSAPDDASLFGPARFRSV